MPMKNQNYESRDGDRSGHHPPDCTYYYRNVAKTPSLRTSFLRGVYIGAVLAALATLSLFISACSTLPDGADAERAIGEQTTESAVGNTPSERDIDRAVDATLDADAQRRATRVARQTVTARVATARAPTPTITPPGLPSLAGEAHDCFMERPEADREATIDDLVRYIRHYEDARAMGKREVFHYRDRFIRVLSGWDREGRPGITSMMESLCPGGDFTYPPPGG